jgi:predicted small secreted protein
MKEFCMKNTIKLFGVIALVAVIGFLMAACGTEPGDTAAGGGKFTLTDIPAEYNGKYAMLWGEPIFGIASFNLTTWSSTLPQIANGSVDLPMWVMTGSEEAPSLARYSGNDTIGIEILISTKGDYDWMEELDPIGGRHFDSVTFSGGNAAKAWSAGTELGEDGEGNALGGGNDALDGTTWMGTHAVGGSVVLAFDSPNFTMTMGSSFTATGTYSISGSTVTMISNDVPQIGTLSGNTMSINNEVTLTKQ